MEWRERESPGAREGAAEAETETTKFQHEYSVSRQFRQARPRHIAEIATTVFLVTCEHQIRRQIEKLSNPAFGGSSRIEAQEYLADILVAYEEVAGRPWSLEVAA
jgi:hypothetical protein